MHALEWIQAEGRFRRAISTGPLRRALRREKRHCTWCDKPVPGRRRTWCSDECIHDFEDRCVPAIYRWRVFRRDQGVCCVCGLDTEDLRRFGERLRATRYAQDLAGGYPASEHRNRRGRANRRRLERYRALVRRDYGLLRATSWWYWLNGRGFNPGQSYWQADHTVPVVEGGGLCGLEGLRSLCVPCHKQMTKELAGRRAKPGETV